MIKLRKRMAQDNDFVFSCLENENEDFMMQCGYSRWHSYPITKNNLTKVMKKRIKDTKYYMILSDSIIIGSVEIDKINWDKKECSIARFLIKEEFRNSGFGNKALKELTQTAFNELGMNRVVLSVYSFNVGAIKCYEKAGYTEYSRQERPNGWIAIKMENVRNSK